MKKSLVALAVAAALPAFAQAQTNVQLTGSIDGALESLNADGNVLYRGGGNVSDLRITNGVWSGSRFAIVGSEDLGGGLKGLFNIEHRLSVDDGTVTGGATFWAGQSWVGLGGGFGTIRFGRQYTPIFRALVPADVTGYSWYNNAYSGPIQVIGTTIVDNGNQGMGRVRTRFANDVSYESPRLGGFTIHAAYAAGEDYSAPLDNKKGDTWGVAGVGAVGPISLGLGYHSIDTGTALDNTTELAASVGAKFGPVGVGLGYAHRDVDGAGKSKGYFLSTSFGIGAGTIYLTLKRNDYANDTTDDGIGLTYSYGLSKRTFAYAAVGYNKVEVPAGQGDDLKPRAIAIGIRHFF